MNDKLIVTVEAYGMKFTLEESADLDVYDFVDKVVEPIMKVLGYHQNSIDKALGDDEEV